MNKDKSSLQSNMQNESASDKDALNYSEYAFFSHLHPAKFPLNQNKYGILVHYPGHICCAFYITYIILTLFCFNFL
jgi:hypothetical protein